MCHPRREKKLYKTLVRVVDFGTILRTRFFRTIPTLSRWRKGFFHTTVPTISTHYPIPPGGGKILRRVEGSTVPAATVKNLQIPTKRSVILFIRRHPNTLLSSQSLSARNDSSPNWLYTLKFRASEDGAFEAPSK